MQYNPICWGGFLPFVGLRALVVTKAIFVQVILLAWGNCPGTDDYWLASVRIFEPPSLRILQPKYDYSDVLLSAN